MPQPKYTEHSPGPWKAVRAFEPDPVQEAWFKEFHENWESEPMVRIVSVPTGTSVTNNHDLFEFRNPYDYKLIEQAPELLRLLKIAVEIIDQTTGVDYSEGNGPLVQAIDAVIKAATTVE